MHLLAFFGIINIFLILLILLITIIFCIEFRKSKKQHQNPKDINDVKEIYVNAAQNVDPEKPINDQVDLLPYDRNYEFPKKNLKIGKVLGSGQFGVVQEAVAAKIVPGEKKTLVAVKTNKIHCESDEIKSLYSELKIMIYLGKHLNIVNLLGAVTKNIEEQELMVIVEHCKFGDLRTFIIKNRPYFVDQIDQSIVLK